MIERLNGVESYKVPEMLMEMLLNPQSREALFTDLRAEGPLTGKDGLRDLFQQEHGDREKLKQDYTPDCLTDLVARLVPKAESYADVCAGTGWKVTMDAENWFRLYREWEAGGKP